MKFAITALLSLFLVSPLHAQGPVYKTSLVAAIAAHGADLATTENCLGSGRCRELNPWLARYDNPATFGAVKMGVASVGLLLTHKLHQNHPKLATLINFGVAAAYSGIAYHNSRVGTK